MAYRDQKFSGLKADIGNNRTNNPDDVIGVKKILGALGLYDADKAPEPHGYMTADADTAIRRFQDVKGLKVDGYMLPDGETERALKATQKPARKVNKFARYLGGSGEVLRYEPEDIDDSPTYRAAMDVNKKRFEDSMVKGVVNGTPHPFMGQILALKDGQSIVLNNPRVPGGADYWDKDISPAEGLRHFDGDQGLGMGRVKFRSTGSLKATRKGDRVFVEGLVDHRFNDVYDFNDEDKAFSGAQNIPGAKPFGIYGSKLEKLKGEVLLERGKIKDHKFKWNSVAGKDLR